MNERAQELKAKARASKKKADGEGDVLTKIAEMPTPDRALAKRLHAVVTANAPDLSERTWYGMPAYANDDKVVCFFRLADKLKDRYATFGFNDRRTSTKATCADRLRAEGADSSTIATRVWWRSPPPFP
jgi:hypothetical protein